MYDKQQIIGIYILSLRKKVIQKNGFLIVC